MKMVEKIIKQLNGIPHILGPDVLKTIQKIKKISIDKFQNI